MTPAGEVRFSLRQKVLLWVLMAYVSVLSVSGTIALRNLLLLVALLIVVWELGGLLLTQRQYATELFSRIPVSFYLWLAVVALFPLWAPDSAAAWGNLRGQWLVTIIAWVVGFGAVVVLGRNVPTIWLLALCSAAPVFLHLFVTMLAWAGLLSQAFLTAPDLTVLTLIRMLGGWFSQGFPGLHWQAFPNGFRGVEPMHGNIGYAASQATTLAIVHLLATRRTRDWHGTIKATLLIVACTASVTIAHSRAAMVFNVLMLLIAIFIDYVSRPDRKNGKRVQVRVGGRKGWMLAAVAVVLALGVVVATGMRHDFNWATMADKVSFGLTLGNPERILCEGLSVEEEAGIRARLNQQSDEYVNSVLAGIRTQDGARFLLMREGWALALTHPLGWDGSRQAYEKLIQQRCGHAPALPFAHAHQAWINLALSLGWLGVAAYFFLLSSMVWKGAHSLQGAERDVSMALLLLAVFWMLRGLFDAVYQDHYLEMQAVMLALLFMKLAPSTSSSHQAA